jgi:Uma2 family endonuclease
MGMSTRTQLTADELLALPDDGKRHELIEGELTTMTPAGFQHGEIVARLLRRVATVAEDRDLGVALGAETGFRLSEDPDTVRAPDVAFVSRERLPGVRQRGYGRGAPDLVAEVVSPSDTYEEVDLKVQQWLRAGTRLVWVVNPRSRTVAVHAPGADVGVLRENDVLDGRGVLPGFSCPVSEIFG